MSAQRGREPFPETRKRDKAQLCHDHPWDLGYISHSLLSTVPPSEKRDDNTDLTGLLRGPIACGSYGERSLSWYAMLWPPYLPFVEGRSPFWQQVPLLCWWPSDFNDTLGSKSRVLSSSDLLQPPCLVNKTPWGLFTRPPVLSFHSAVTERSDLVSSSLGGEDIWWPGPPGQQPFKKRLVSATPPLCQRARGWGGRAQLSLLTIVWELGGRKNQGRELAVTASSSDSSWICFESIIR